MASNENNIELHLQDCYEVDIDWSLIPPKLHNVCEIWAKNMKQQKTTVLVAIISLVSAATGHASVSVKDAWDEPIIVWMAIALKTGRCKSSLHGFLEKIMEEVEERTIKDNDERSMLMPHCTWDKFGEILANNGARIYALYDELTSFFSIMNMYSSSRASVQDNREYQDFLKMFTGKSKKRETITGNANYHMSQTSLTLFGFTQPHTCLPIIHNPQNNAKGFTSRILWYFPEPIYSRLRDLELTEEERHIAQEARDTLVNLLTTLFDDGENSFEMCENKKVVEVKVTRDVYRLSEAAKREFTRIHDDYEINICQKYHVDNLISGLFARGNSHVIRLSVPLQILFEAFNNSEEGSAENTIASADGEETSSDSQELFSPLERPKVVDAPAILAAHSIVDTCLKHCCFMNGKGTIFKENDENEEITQSNPPPTPVRRTADPHTKFYKAILLTPGPIVSMSLLITKGKFKRAKVDDCTGAAAAKMLIEAVANKGLGRMLQYRRANNTTIVFLRKAEVPDDMAEKQSMAKILASFGITLRSYTEMLCKNDELSRLHARDFDNRKKAECPNEKPDNGKDEE